MKGYWLQIKDFLTRKTAYFQTYVRFGLSALTIFLMVAFAESQYADQEVGETKIDIKAPLNHEFVKQKDVRYMIRDQFNTPLEEKQQDQLNLAAMEKKFESNPFVKDAEVFNNLSGTLTIKIEQRKPMMRVINHKGNSFYLDQAGQKMPTAIQYTAPVITAKGHIYSSAQNLDSVSSSTVRSLYKVSGYIKRDTFLNALIGSIEVNQQQEFELTPRAGQQTIILGEARDLEDRFQKLEAFYRKVLPNKGWHQYNEINLKFKKQIVAKK